MKRPTVVIAEDYILIQEMMRCLLEPECDVVAAVENAKEVRAAIGTYHPDIVLLDISLPGENGFEVMEGVARDWPEIKVIFVSGHRNQEYVKQAFELGAKGYVLKTNVATELSRAIREVSEGGEYRSVLIARNGAG